MTSLQKNYFSYTWSLRKQPTFHDATTGFPAKWRLMNDCRTDSTPCHYPLFWVVLLIDGTGREICFDHSEALSTQICAVTRHQYGIFKLPSKTLFRKKPAAVASRKVGCFLVFFQYKLFISFFCFWALKQRKTPESDFFVAVPCKLHNHCCIVWRFSKRLYLLCYDRLVSLNDHVTPWSSILYPNT